jgi:hypothetical protein
MRSLLVATIAGTAIIALATPSYAVPPAQPNGTVPSANKQSQPKGSAAGAEGTAHLTVPLQAQNGSGETGTATLRQSGPNVVVTIALHGEDTAAQPAHIHDGTCAKLDPKPAYPLTPIANGSSQTTIKGVTIAKLTSEPYAINVHQSASQLKKYVACGDVKS